MIFELISRTSEEDAVDDDRVARLVRSSTLRARELRRSATPAEQVFWRLVRGRQLGAKFRRQQPLGPFIVDFFCDEARLVIELDGAGHFPRPRRDVLRDLYFEYAGVTVLRFENVEVLEHPERVLACIRACLSPERGREGG